VAVVRADFVSPLRLPEADPFAHLADIKQTAADLELNRAFVTVQVRRQPRAKCAACRLRRVLYRIAALMAGGTGETEARCSECWGIRDHV
jgi:hypothetical protein